MLRRLVRAPDQAVTVAAADSAVTASAATEALVVRLRPVGNNQGGSTLAVRVVAAAEEFPAVEGRCCMYSALGNSGELLKPVSRGSS